MSNQRRNFVRNMALASIGTSLYASDILAGNSILQYNKSNHSIIKSFKEGERIIFERLLEDGYQISTKNQFLLNEHCTAYQISKNSLLWGKEEKLLLIVDNDYFLLSEQQQQTYDDFISSYAVGVKENNIHLGISDFVTPIKILQTNKHGDFRFKNTYGNIFEVHAKSKRAYVKIAS